MKREKTVYTKVLIERIMCSQDSFAPPQDIPIQHSVLVSNIRIPFFQLITVHIQSMILPFQTTQMPARPQRVFHDSSGLEKFHSSSPSMILLFNPTLF
jgi:hypothetical protein